VSIPEVSSKNRLLFFLERSLRKLKGPVTLAESLTAESITTTNLTGSLARISDLTVPTRSADADDPPPVDFEQVGGLVIGETIIPSEESSSSTFSWTLAGPPSNAQDWHASSDFHGIARVMFTVPASGRVEIQVRCSLDAGAANDRIYMRLCTATSGASLATRYQKMVLRTNATPECVLVQTWALLGLTPGTLTTYYLGAAADGGTHYIKAGGACSGDTDVTTEAWPQFIMRAVAISSNALTT
tara:strand:+ start:922 stop:1650 length:729 start_codon:yes stop_codon:yes gene_type:complete